MNTSNSCRIGDTAEFLFDARAVQRGFIVNRPIHAGTIYDRVVESEGRFLKVQIKCVTKDNKYGGVEVSLRRNNNKTYPIDRVDIIAVYVLHRDTWHFFRNTGLSNVYIKDKTPKENWDIFYEKVQDHIQEV